MHLAICVVQFVILLLYCPLCTDEYEFTYRRYCQLLTLGKMWSVVNFLFFTSNHKELTSMSGSSSRYVTAGVALTNNNLQVMILYTVSDSKLFLNHFNPFLTFWANLLFHLVLFEICFANISGVILVMCYVGLRYLWSTLLRLLFVLFIHLILSYFLLVVFLIFMYLCYILCVLLPINKDVQKLINVPILTLNIIFNRLHKPR